jgi:hypothetical protein
VDVPDSPETPTEDMATAATLGLLAMVEDLRGRAGTIQRGLRPGSLLATDLKSPVGTYVIDLASMKIAVAGDHLMAFDLLANGMHRIPTWAHLSLLRATTEAALEGRWLLDGDLESEVRVGRAVGRQIYDYEERSKAERELGTLPEWPPQDLVPASTWIAELVQQASDAGIVPQGYPGATEVARSFKTCGQGLDVYFLRFLGGAVHGVQWATALGDVEATDLDGAFSAVHTKASALGTWYATRCAIAHYSEAIASMERYVGL